MKFERTGLIERDRDIGDDRSEITGARDVRNEERVVRSERERRVGEHMEAMRTAHPGLLAEKMADRAPKVIR